KPEENQEGGRRGPCLLDSDFWLLTSAFSLLPRLRRRPLRLRRPRRGEFRHAAEHAQRIPPDLHAGVRLGQLADLCQQRPPADRPAVPARRLPPAPPGPRPCSAAAGCRRRKVAATAPASPRRAPARVRSASP